MIENILTLLMATFLQAVLSIDNMLYISLESKNAPKVKADFVRNAGIIIAIILRIILLFVFVFILGRFTKPLFGIPDNQFFTGEFTLHGIIELVGGAFIIYTAVKEIWHLLSIEDLEHENDKKGVSMGKIFTMMIVMNLIFSFDSILSVIAFTDVFWVMLTAVVLGGLIMIWLSTKITKFLEKNKKFEILGLFILFLVGVMLMTEAAHLSDIRVFGNEIHALHSSTFYFLLVVLVVVDILQTRYKRKLDKVKKDGK
ncbi:MAG: hypothetical protein JXL97_11130 [Bacteroidales bacterium]|nr:hypothetical protein [Bacteroidales bacterium]